MQEQAIDFRIIIKKDAVITHHNDDFIDIQESLEPLTQEQPRYLTDCTIYLATKLGLVVSAPEVLLRGGVCLPHQTELG